MDLVPFVDAGQAVRDFTGLPDTVGELPKAFSALVDLVDRIRQEGITEGLRVILPELHTLVTKGECLNDERKCELMAKMVTEKLADILTGKFALSIAQKLGLGRGGLRAKGGGPGQRRA